MRDVLRKGVDPREQISPPGPRRSAPAEAPKFVSSIQLTLGSSSDVPNLRCVPTILRFAAVQARDVRSAREYLLQTVCTAYNIICILINSLDRIGLGGDRTVFTLVFQKQ